MSYTTKQLGQMLSAARKTVNSVCTVCGKPMVNVLPSKKTCSMACRHKRFQAKRAQEQGESK